jgi:diguanylate cyclase (GGDEF)-like protein
MQSARSQEAKLLAQRIRDHLENFVFQDVAGQDFRVTVSIGITFNRTEDKHIQKLIERADKALYQAKRDGRNRVREQP